MTISVAHHLFLNDNSSAMLKVEKLVKRYQGQTAVDEVSLEIEKGKIFGLLGPNGAGKSSLLRMITGITLPDEGIVYLNNEVFDLNKHKSLIGYMPEERGLYKKMKVREHLVYLARLKDLSKAEANSAIDYWFARLDMHTWANKKVEDLSKGMSQKLQFVATVVHQPPLLILDEPFSGLDPVNAKIIKDEIFHLAQTGTTIIFSTHRMEQVEEICEQIALMDKGRIILNGEVNAIKQTYKNDRFELKIAQDGTEAFPFNVINQKGNEYIIQLAEGEKSKNLLSYCVERDLEMLSFKELLPSLNDIFIALVEKTAIRQFDK